jgi:eukaryotic-like serine/threonine-protein kinase
LSAIGKSEYHSPEDWRRIRAIFDEAQAFPLDQRTLLLERLCQGDADLLEEVGSLLEASDAEEELAENFSNATETTFRPGRIGPYEIDRLLGRGGMGAVYLAHRADGNFEQKLAIKLIDVPLASDLFRKQFRMEQQILAGLSHPYITRLLDGGVSANGELYLAMEYVDGEPILNYCKRKQLGLHDRLRLFINVCSAVQYAHQNLVVHRDLKPDNILVVDDGTPRLLDFGTAKLVTPFPEDRTSELTLRGLRSFTPQYASPEQILERPISIATDIYSLGVILFQLLADVPPYVLNDFNTEEMLRVICVEQPPKPSAVAVSVEKPDADLDSIALMALRKEANERYLTVDAFAADIQAWLQGRPVMARRGTLSYRAVKFASRNRLALSGAALLLAAIVCGMAGVLWQSRVANLERIRAEASVQEMCELSDNFLSEIDQAVNQLPNSTSVRHLMVRRVAEHLDRVPRDTSGDRLARLYLVKAYVQLARLQGDQAEQNLGDGAGALQSLDKAWAVAHDLKSEYPNDREVNKALVLALNVKSEILYGIGKPEEAVAALKPAVEILSEEIESPQATSAQIADAADAFSLLGAELGDPETPSLGDYSAAVTAYGKANELYKRALAIDPAFIRAKREIATNGASAGHILVFTDPVAAIDELHNSLALWDALPVSAKTDAESRMRIEFTQNILGKALSRARNYPAAIATYDATRKAMEQGAASDAADSRALTFLAGILGDEAETYMDMLNPLLNPGGEKSRRKNAEQATALLRRSISLWEKLLALDPNNELFAARLAYEQAQLSTLGQSTGSPNDPVQSAASSVAALRRLASRSDAPSDILYRAASVMVSPLPARLRDDQLAVQYAERLSALNHRTDPTSLLLLAQAYSADGQQERARTTAREALNLLSPRVPGARAVRCKVLLEEIMKGSSNR